MRDRLRLSPAVPRLTMQLPATEYVASLDGLFQQPCAAAHRLPWRLRVGESAQLLCEGFSGLSLLERRPIENDRMPDWRFVRRDIQLPVIATASASVRRHEIAAGEYLAS